MPAFVRAELSAPDGSDWGLPAWRATLARTARQNPIDDPRRQGVDVRGCIAMRIWDVVPAHGAGSLNVAPLSRAGLLRCASSRWLSPPSRPLTGGHPSREHGKAGGAGRDHDSGSFPCPGSADPDSFTLRVNEARLAN